MSDIFKERRLLKVNGFATGKWECLVLDGRWCAHDDPAFSYTTIIAPAVSVSQNNVRCQIRIVLGQRLQPLAHSGPFRFYRVMASRSSHTLVLRSTAHRATRAAALLRVAELEAQRSTRTTRLKLSSRRATRPRRLLTFRVVHLPIPRLPQWRHTRVAAVGQHGTRH